MNRYLEASYQFHVSERAGVFTVCELIGKGASCAVYRADFTDEHGNQTQHLLKEYHPSRMEMDREDSGALVPEDEKKFREGLRRFHSCYEKQLQIRRISGLKNTTSNIQGIYHANGTQYIDMTCFQGQTYDKLREQSVYDLMRRMRALTSVIDNYHKAGFLHLDIKPSNIYTIPETCEMVMLFDFDSVVEKENILSGGGLSYSKAWAAPEQFLPGYEKNICEATDLFAVGEIIFFALFGRHSSRTERRSFAEYSFDYEADIFQNMNPRVFPLLRDLLRHTICGVVSKRYRTAEELLVRLDEIIQLADPKEPYIGKNLPYAESFFVGRDDELIEIHENLQQNRILFLNGIGGIGKSELAKRYAKQYQDCYNSICFAPYLDNVNMLIGSDLSLPICNFTPYPEEKPDDYCARKLRKLNKLCDERTLIIIDNLDRSDDPDLKKLLDLNCKLLITTRVDFSKYGCGQQMQLDVLRNAEDIYSIFTRYYDGKLTKEERPIVDEIIDLVAGHTLTVELIAKQIDAEWATPAEILEKLKNAGVHAIGDSDVDSDKDGVFSSKSTFAHIQALFDLSVFDHADKESELYVLNNLCLFPYTGIDQKLFAEWIELEKHGGKNVVNNLIKTGWIRRSKQSISLHPVVADVAMASSNNTSFSDTLYSNIASMLNNKTFSELSYTEKTILLDIFTHLALQAVHYTLKSKYIIDYLSSDFWLDYGLYRLNDSYNLIYTIYNTAIEIGINLYGKSSQELVDPIGNIALLLAYMGDYTHADEKMQQAIEIAEKHAGENLHLLGHLYGNYAFLLSEKKEFIRSKECFMKALSTLTAGREPPQGISIVLNNLGALLQDMDNYDEAKKTYLKAIDLLNMSGCKNADLSIAYNNLGKLYMELGEYDRALSSYCNAMDVNLELFGETNALTSNSLYGMAFVYIRRKDYKKAEELLKKVLSIRKSIFVKGIPVASTMNLLGGLYYEMGDNSSAVKFYTKALIMFRDACGDFNNYVATSFHNLGALYEEQNELENAEIYLKKAISIKEDLIGKSHSDTAGSYFRLGLVYLKRREPILARGYIQKAYNIYKTVYGETHSITIEVYNQLNNLDEI